MIIRSVRIDEISIHIPACIKIVTDVPETDAVAYFSAFSCELRIVSTDIMPTRINQLKSLTSNLHDARHLGLFESRETLSTSR
jgi:hypothetical protein